MTSECAYHLNYYMNIYKANKKKYKTSVFVTIHTSIFAEDMYSMALFRKLR